MNTLKSQWKEKWVNQPSLMLITVVIWSIFIGLCIQAGALFFTSIYSFFNPIVAQNLYEGLNLSFGSGIALWEKHSNSVPGSSDPCFMHLFYPTIMCSGLHLRLKVGTTGCINVVTVLLQ